MTIESAPFAQTFGPKATRKRAKISATSLSDFRQDAENSLDTYLDKRQTKLANGLEGEPEDAGDNTEDETLSSIPREAVFTKGQSRRIWNELYRLVEFS